MSSEQNCLSLFPRLSSYTSHAKDITCCQNRIVTEKRKCSIKIHVVYFGQTHSIPKLAAAEVVYSYY